MSRVGLLGGVRPVGESRTRSRFLEITPFVMARLGFVEVVPRRNKHAFDTRGFLLGNSIVRGRRAHLAPAAVQQGLCRRYPRPCRDVRVLHDFRQHRDRGLALFARQRPYVYRGICFIRSHGKEGGGPVGVNQSVGAGGSKLQESLMGVVAMSNAPGQAAVCRLPTLSGYSGLRLAP